jgi:long-chain fatty acid transport protein
MTLACGAALTAVNPTALASGFAVPELNVPGIALSNALVANPDLLAAIPYNPAAMSFHDGKSAAFGLMLVKPDLSVDTGSGFIDSEADDVVAIPSVAAHMTLNETWSLGVAVNAPFGLETEWAPGTFPEAPADPSGYPLGSTIPTQSKLEILAVSPSFAYKVSDDVSLAGGIDIYDMREVIFNGDANAGSPGSNPAADLNGDGHGVGFNLGLMVRRGNWTFGGSYHSEANIEVEGKVSLPAGSLPAFASNEVNAELRLPSRLQLGVRNQTTKKLAIEFDFTRTGWSSFDKLVVDHDQFGFNVVTSNNMWDDTSAYRLGVTYDISPETQLRAGYTYDETGQKDEFFSPRIPDADRQLFSMGLGHTFANGWTLDASYMYVKFDDREINQTEFHTGDLADETNGTPAVNGDYKSSVSLLGVGVTKQFM